MDYDKIVCNCQNVTNGMIKSAVDAGASTLGGTGCYRRWNSMWCLRRRYTAPD